MTKIKAVIFDLDNTLIDFWKFKYKCMDSGIDAMIKAGLKIKKKKAEEIVDKLYKKLGMEYKYIFQKFLKRVLGKIDYRLLAHALVSYRKARRGMLIPYSGVVFTMKKLKKKHKLAIVSDAPCLKAWNRLVLMKIDNMFDAVVTFEDTKQRKPGKLPFLTVLRKLKIKASEVLLVGDSISRDMVGAKKVGMKTALALYGRTIIPRKKPKNVDYMLERISDLLKILK